jgi:hypothetical protein
VLRGHSMAHHTNARVDSSARFWQQHGTFTAVLAGRWGAHKLLCRRRRTPASRSVHCRMQGLRSLRQLQLQAALAPWCLGAPRGCCLRPFAVLHACAASEMPCPLVHSVYFIACYGSFDVGGWLSLQCIPLPPFHSAGDTASVCVCVCVCVLGKVRRNASRTQATHSVCATVSCVPQSRECNAAMLLCHSQRGVWRAPVAECATDCACVCVSVCVCVCASVYVVMCTSRCGRCADVCVSVDGVCLVFRPVLRHSSVVQALVSAWCALGRRSAPVRLADANSPCTCTATASVCMRVCLCLCVCHCVPHLSEVRARL